MEYYNQIQQKPDIFNSNDSFINKDLIEMKNRSIEYIQIGMFVTALKSFNLLSELTKSNIEQVKFKEIQAIIKFYIDYHDSRDQNTSIGSSNSEIQKLYESIINGYRKLKQIDLLSESILRLSIYYSYISDKRRECLDNIHKVYLESISLTSHNKLRIYCHCYSLLIDLKFNKKAVLFLVSAINLCFDLTQNKLHVIPYLYEELKKLFQIYNIRDYQITSRELFDTIHNEIIQHNRKKLSFWEQLRTLGENKFSQVKKKRVEADYILCVNVNLYRYNNILLTPNWQPIQHKILLDLLNYNKEIMNSKLIIAYSLCLLQTLHSFLSSNDQKTILENLNAESNALQEKLNLNMIKMPILVKILPITNNIKIEKKKQLNSINSVFLYNPWEKSKAVNYSWTVNSFQHVMINFYNPLSVTIVINNISVFFEGEQPLCFPSNAAIEPLSSLELIHKILFLKEGYCTILGVKYEIGNTIGMQYIDSNGNGLLYSYENISKDPYSLANYKKEILSLNNIQIHPEIPQLEMTLIDNHLANEHNTLPSIKLYEYQCYPFSFKFVNHSMYSIEELKISIYAFKKDDYKILLDESVLQSKNKTCLIESKSSYNYYYEYIHKKGHKKIEFRFYYKWNSKENEYDSILIKPLCYYITKISSQKLISYHNMKLVPMLYNNTIKQLINKDQRIKKDYSIFTISLQFYITFEVKLLNNSLPLPLQIDIINTIQIIKTHFITASDPNLTKEIGFMIENKNKLNEVIFNWTLINEKNNKTNDKNCKGKIDLFQLMVNELNFRFLNEIMFEIETEKAIDGGGNQFLLIKHIIRNKSKRVYFNMRFYIYLYQIYENEIVFKTHLDQNIFYEGSLFYLIKEIKGMEVIEYQVNLYPPCNEMINTTSVLIDDTYKIIYLNTISKECFFNL